ncbi:MAG: hypothetical protein JRI64_10060 [Deltaproteobacteria bacterium]|nr:hypothetical protein [Deltaproteobacteria bacterium]
MVRGKHKTVTFDAMVKFFIQQYDIPTKKDIEKLYTRLDRLEKLIRTTQRKATRQGPGKTGAAKTKKGKNVLTASDVVFGTIKRSKKGLKISDIKLKTKFEDKKLRNILFRLHKLGRIKRLSRGIYTSA